MNKKGFTLMEVVIAVSLLGILSIVSVNIVTNLLRSAVKSQTAVDVQEASNFVTLKLRNDIESAYKVTLTGTNILNIHYTSSSTPDVVYTVGLCNADAGINCVKRRESGGVEVFLTDATSDSTDDAKASSSAVAVGVRDASTPYFSVVNSSTPPRTLAVNVVMKFYKPQVTSLKNFSGISILDTTIVLPRM